MVMGRPSPPGRPCSRYIEMPASPVSPHLMHGLSSSAYRATRSVLNASCLSRARMATDRVCLSDVTARYLSDPSYAPQNHLGRVKHHQTDIRTPPPLQCRQKTSQDERTEPPLHPPLKPPLSRVRRTAK